MRCYPRRPVFHCRPCNCNMSTYEDSYWMPAPVNAKRDNRFENRQKDSSGTSLHFNLLLLPDDVDLTCKRPLATAILQDAAYSYLLSHFCSSFKASLGITRTLLTKPFVQTNSF